MDTPLVSCAFLAQEDPTGRPTGQYAIGMDFLLEDSRHVYLLTGTMTDLIRYLTLEASEPEWRLFADYILPDLPEEDRRAYYLALANVSQGKPQ